MRWHTVVWGALLAIVATVAFAQQVNNIRTVPPHYAYALFNLLLVVVLGLIAWLMKRAISGTDESIKQATTKIDNMVTQISEIRVMIAGDLYPRKEHMEYARHVDEQMNMLRKSIHDLRDEIQPLVNRLTILEALMRKEKS